MMMTYVIIAYNIRVQSAYEMVLLYVYNVGRGLFDERKAYWHNDESNQ